LFCNSSKSWNFEDPSCLEQHREFEEVPSISFPETHDTDRLAQETNGREAIQRQRYAFAAIFSAGVMIPMGYEFGFRHKLRVVETQPSDWEAGSMDLQPFIQALNETKLKVPLLQGEGALDQVRVGHPSLLVLSRRSEYAPEHKGWIVVNRHWEQPVQLSLNEVVGLDGVPHVMDLTKAEQTRLAPINGDHITIDPAGVLLLSLER